nr:type II toxin-antitoxin system HicA family toxin [Rhodospirillum rubrum]
MDIERLFLALGGTVDDSREGSRVAVSLNGIRAVFHRPHPRPCTEKGALRSVRRFLVAAGIVEEG